MINIFNQNHFIRKNINKTYFDEIFSEYEKKIDPSKLFLIEKDIEQMKRRNVLKNKTIDEIAKIPHRAQEILKKRVPIIESYIVSLLKKPISFKNNDIFIRDLKEGDNKYAKDLKALKEKWRLYVKYLVLNAVLLKTVTDKKDLKSKKEVISFKEAEKESRKERLERLKKYLVPYKKRKLADYINLYLSSIASSYDHYSQYLPPIAKQTFDIQMSGKLEGIGAQITDSADGFIEVVRIIIGGASHRQKELEAGDVILKVAQGNGSAVNMQEYSSTEALKYIRGKKGTIVKLTVRKKSGEIKVIAIERDVVTLEATYSKATILEKNNKKYGYIKLPRFYRDFNDKYAKSTHEDIKKQLDNFNKHKVEGLILDLRYNGGGSLYEAIQVGGLFLGNRPIVRVRNNSSELKVKIDSEYKEAVFKKPVVVMVNRYSASASEILAGALQDYKRAVIIGDEQTYGKGTVQTIIELDSIFPFFQAYERDFGSIKMTIQKYYRVTGVSTQTIGVKSDIILPNSTLFEPITEKRYLKYSNDTLSSLKLEAWNKNNYNLQRVIAKSKKRVKKNNIFNNINMLKSIENKQNNKKYINLNYLKAKENAENLLKMRKKYSIENKKKYFKLFKDAKQDKETKKWIEEEVNKDTYINESVKILIDMIN